MEEYELVKVNGSYKPKALVAGLGKKSCGVEMPSNLREGWLKAKEEGRLTGCGLMGNLTMDDIEDLQRRVEEAMTTWSRLSGTRKVFVPEDPNKAVTDIYEKVREMEVSMSLIDASNSKLNKDVAELKKPKKVKTDGKILFDVDCI
jgi:hypothetical protein